MQTIKFRAWDKKNKKMQFSGELGSNSFLEWHEMYHYVKSEIDPEVKVMQFTGLFDKHGKEIYEGDIIRFPIDEYITLDDVREKMVKSEVLFGSRGAVTKNDYSVDDLTDKILCVNPDIEPTGAGVRVVTKKSSFFTSGVEKQYYQNTVEIIGNIYEN